MAVVYITILLLTFISSSLGHQYSKEIEDRLMYQEKTIETLLRLLQQPCYLINPRQSPHTIPGSIIAMTIQQRIADARRRGRNHHWRGGPVYRFGSGKIDKSNNSKPRDFIKNGLPGQEGGTEPDFDNDFYRALSKVLRTEIKRRPELRQVIGDDIKKINIGDPDIF